MIKKSVLLSALLLTSASQAVMASDLTAVEPSQKSSQIKLLAVGEFPNYFEYLDSAERLRLVEQSFSSILSGLQVPHHAETSDALDYDDFFKKIVALVHRQDATAKVYIAGGMVRSLLGYDYKKLYRSVDRAIVKAYEDKEEAEPTGTVVKSTLQRLSDGQRTKRRHFLKTLGVSSDFDILIDFSDTVAENVKGSIIKLVTNFINSAESFLGLTKDKSKIKKSVVPVGDVKDYQKQLGFKGDRSAVLQGGLSLDWLAFDLVEKKIRMPEEHQDILDAFFRGKLQYLPARDGTPTPDKQIIRALRPLIEIPFTSYDEPSEERLAADLSLLSGKISSDAEEQIEKMIRNARDASAQNLFAKPGRGPVNPKVRQATKQFSDKFKTQNTKILPPAAEFLETRNIQLRTADKGNLKASNVLMPVEELVSKHTDNLIVQHGTPDLVNVLNMMRNGFLVSKEGQGMSAYGSGFYASKDVKVALGYAKNEGIVIPLQINAHKNLRILDLKSTAAKEFVEEVKKRFPDQDLHEVLANEYDIDIIVTDYLLIQNAAALKLPKDIKVLLQAQIDLTEKEIGEKLKDNPAYREIKGLLDKWVHQLHPKKGFTQLLLALGGKTSGKGLGQLAAYLEKQIQQDNVLAADLVLKNRDAFTPSEHAFQIVDKYVRASSAISLGADFIKKWYAVLNEQNFGGIELDEAIRSFKKNYVAKYTYDQSGLLRAVSAGNSAVVAFLVEAGADLGSRDVYLNTAASLAAMHNNTEILRLLAEKGADLEVKDKDDRTPLLIAASSGSTHALAFLVERKANVNAKDNEGRSVLCRAAINGNLDAVKLLVENGADPLAVDNNGSTPFANAASHGKKEVADYLLSLGTASIHEKDNFGNSILAQAAMQGQLDAVKDFHQRGLKIDEPNRHGITPLALAANYGRLNVIQYLVENKADVNSKNKVGITSLEGAVRGGHLDSVKFMVDNGADLNPTMDQGKTMLTVAAQADHVEVAKYLVQQGLDVNVFINPGVNLLREKGDSLISWAAEKNDDELVCMLIERGADFRTASKHGQSLQVWAVENEHHKVLEAMVERGLDVKATDADGKTLLQIAIDSFHTNTDTIRILIDNGDNTNITDRNGDSLICVFAKRGKADLVKLFLDRGESVESKSSEGKTLFFLAAMYGHVDVLRLLIEAGANKHIQCGLGEESGLHVATFNKHLAVVQFLVGQGLDPKATSKWGQTPYMIALEKKAMEIAAYFESIQADIITPGRPATALLMGAAEGGNLPLVSVLLDKGVDIESKGDYGEAPLTRAAAWGRLDLVKHLLERGANKDAKDEFGGTCLHKAASMGNTAVVEFLIGIGLSVNAQENFGHTPLFSAAATDKLETLEYLLGHGADAKVLDHDGLNVALFSARQNNNPKTLEFLASKGIDLGIKDRYGNAILSIAAAAGKVQVVQYLLDQGHGIEETNNVGETALTRAKLAGKTEVVQLLLRKGTKVQAKNP